MTDEESRDHGARRHGLSGATVRGRMLRGWSLDRALTTPIRRSVEETLAEVPADPMRRRRAA